MEDSHLFIQGNYFNSEIVRVEPSLEAMFVNFGADRYGFLPLTDFEHYDKKIHKPGATIIVSIVKPEHGQKGAQVKAHQHVPDGIQVHKLLSPRKDTRIKTRLFYVLAVVTLAFIVYTKAQ